MPGDEWLVSEASCKGCIYYGALSQYKTASNRCCLYTYFTGKVRENPPRRCEVKVLGKRLNGSRSTTGCVVPRKEPYKTLYSEPYRRENDKF